MYPEWVPDWFINGPDQSSYWVIFLCTFFWVHIMIHLRFGIWGGNRAPRPKHGRHHRHLRMEFHLPKRTSGRGIRHGGRTDRQR